MRLLQSGTELLVTLNLRSLLIYLMCVCVCVCVYSNPRICTFLHEELRTRILCDVDDE